jgi:hypothetical protein
LAFPRPIWRRAGPDRRQTAGKQVAGGCFNAFIQTKTLSRAGSIDTLRVANFADRAAPGGVGTFARTLGTMPPQSGDENFYNPEAGQ